MMLLTLFYILAGLCTGSFLALCADRLPRGESLFFQLLIVMPAVIGWAFLI